MKIRVELCACHSVPTTSLYRSRPSLQSRSQPAHSWGLPILLLMRSSHTCTFICILYSLDGPNIYIYDVFIVHVLITFTFTKSRWLLSVICIVINIIRFKICSPANSDFLVQWVYVFRCIAPCPYRWARICSIAYTTLYPG